MENPILLEEPAETLLEQHAEKKTLLLSITRR